jgi:hypothetical protein
MNRALVVSLGLFACTSNHYGEPAEPSIIDPVEEDALDRLDKLEVLDVGDVIVQSPAENCYGCEASEAEWAEAERQAWERLEAFVDTAVDAVALVSDGTAYVSCDPDEASADLAAIQALNIVEVFGIVGVASADGELLVDDDDCATLHKLEAIAAMTADR